MVKIGIDISVLNDKNRTGIGVYAFELIKALLKINQKDKFILFGIATLSTYEYLKNLEFKDYPNVEMKIYKMPAKFFRQAFLLWQKLNWPKVEYFIGPVDVFHSFNWFMPPQKRGKRVATVFDLTSVLYAQWHDPKTTQLDKIRFQKIAHDADLVITISQSTKNDFLKLQPQGRVEVVYPATRNFTNTGSLKKYDLQPGYLLTVGTLEPRKNLENLIKAYLKSKIDNQLVLVGKSGWKNEELLSLIKKYPQKIKQLGFVPDEDLPRLYKNAQAFIYPSFYEGFGIPVLEALSFDIPVITSNISSLPEVGGKAVTYIDPNDIDDIAKSLTKIKKTGLEIKQAKEFTWEKSAQQLNFLYQSLK